MSGIYIPDMVMPEEKGSHEIKITLFVREDGTAGLWGTEIYIPHEPLTIIPVPDHGRLIEAVMLRNKCYQHYEDFMKGKIDGKTALLNIEKEIIDAPTIIPASTADKEGEG